MHVDVSLQLAQLALSVLTGFALGVLYDILRAMRRVLRINAALDALFCAALLFALFTLGMDIGQGGVHVFMFCAAAAGCAAYMSLLSAALLPLFEKIAVFAAKAADAADYMRKLRESKGLTQDQLAEKLFVTRQTVSNYETGRTRPDVDMIVSIANVLETDANSVIYGLPADDRKQNTLKIIVSISITAICTVAFAMVLRAAQTVMYETYHARSAEVLIALLCPPVIMLAGWCVMQLISHFAKVEPILTRKSRIARFAIIFMIFASYVIVIPYEMWLLAAEGGNQAVPLSQNTIFYWLYRAILTADVRFPWVYALIGAALWIFRAPLKQQNAESCGESCRA